MLLATLLLGVLYGVLAERHDLPPTASIRKLEEAGFGWLSGRGKRVQAAEAPTWRLLRKARSRTGSSGEPDEEQRRAIAELEALGYAAAVSEAGDLVGVVQHDVAAADNGLNLVITGHAPEARLLDMQGRELHRWFLPFTEAFPGRPPSTAVGAHYWRRVELLSNGELLAIYEGQGLVRIDRDSHVLWAYPGGAHHHLEVMPNGSIYVLTRKAELLREINPSQPVLHDFVTVLDPGGNELRKVSVLRALQRSTYASLLDQAPRRNDILHTNTIDVLEGFDAERMPAFRAGNVLLSIPKLNTVAVIDMDTETVVWAMTGLWEFQHESTLLPDGHLLVFDNRGQPGASRILELDPSTQEILWSYDGREHDFYSESCGALDRLPNGNTLITETDNGRAFEVTAGGRTVWEYYCPFVTGEHDELVYRLFEVTRIRPDFVAGWLDTGPQVAPSELAAPPR